MEDVQNNAVEQAPAPEVKVNTFSLPSEEIAFDNDFTLIPESFGLSSDIEETKRRALIERMRSNGDKRNVAELLKDSIKDGTLSAAEVATLAAIGLRIAVAGLPVVYVRADALEGDEDESDE